MNYSPKIKCGRVALPMILLLAGCADDGGPAVGQVGICLRGASEVRALKTQVEAFAAKNGLEFRDETAATRENDRVMNSSSHAPPVIAWRLAGNGRGVSIGSVSGTTGGVSVRVGPNNPTGAALMSAFVNQLATTWKTMPLGKVPSADDFRGCQPR